MGFSIPEGNGGSTSDVIVKRGRGASLQAGSDECSGELSDNICGETAVNVIFTWIRRVSRSKKTIFCFPLNLSPLCVSSSPTFLLWLYQYRFSAQRGLVRPFRV
jgi:hypothetical protein